MLTLHTCLLLPRDAFGMWQTQFLTIDVSLSSFSVSYYDFLRFSLRTTPAVPPCAPLFVFHRKFMRPTLNLPACMHIQSSVHSHLFGLTLRCASLVIRKCRSSSKSQISIKITTPTLALFKCYC